MRRRLARPPYTHSNQHQFCYVVARDAAVNYIKLECWSVSREPARFVEVLHTNFLTTFSDGEVVNPSVGHELLDLFVRVRRHAEGRVDDYVRGCLDTLMSLTGQKLKCSMLVNYCLARAALDRQPMGASELNALKQDTNTRESKQMNLNLKVVEMLMRCKLPDELLHSTIDDQRVNDLDLEVDDQGMDDQEGGALGVDGRYAPHNSGFNVISISNDYENHVASKGTLDNNAQLEATHPVGTSPLLLFLDSSFTGPNAEESTERNPGDHINVEDHMNEEQHIRAELESSRLGRLLDPAAMRDAKCPRTPLDKDMMQNVVAGFLQEFQEGAAEFPDPLSFHTLLSSCARLGMWSEALGFLHALDVADRFCVVSSGTRLDPDDGEGPGEPHVRGSEVRESHVGGSEVRESHVRESEVRESHVRESEVRESHVRESEFRESHMRESQIGGLPEWQSVDLKAHEVVSGSTQYWVEISCRGKRLGELLSVCREVRLACHEFLGERRAAELSAGSIWTEERMETPAFVRQAVEDCGELQRVVCEYASLTKGADGGLEFLVFGPGLSFEDSVYVADRVYSFSPPPLWWSLTVATRQTVIRESVKGAAYADCAFYYALFMALLASSEREIAFYTGMEKYVDPRKRREPGEESLREEKFSANAINKETFFQRFSRGLILMARSPIQDCQLILALCCLQLTRPRRAKKWDKLLAQVIEEFEEEALHREFARDDVRWSEVDERGQILGRLLKRVWQEPHPGASVTSTCEIVEEQIPAMDASLENVAQRCEWVVASAIDWPRLGQQIIDCMAVAHLPI